MYSFAAFAIGNFAGSMFITSGMGLVPLGVAGLCVAVGVLGPARWRSLLLSACVLFLGCGWAMLRLDPDHPTRLDSVIAKLDPQLSASVRNVPIEVRGILTQPSRVTHRVHGLADPPMWEDMRNQAEIRISAVLVHEPGAIREWQPASGSLRLILPEGVRLRGGQRFELLGRFTPSGARRNPGEPDWSKLAAQRGHAGSLMIEHAEHLTPIAPGGLIQRAHSWWLRARGEIRDRALRSIGLDDDSASDEHVAMRAALLLGERDPRFDEVFTTFQRVGVAHVLAISGFHLALVILMLSFAVRLIGEYPKVHTAVILVALLGVAVLIPLRPPIVRASLIVGAMVLSHAAGRRYDRMTILAWVGVGLLVWRPMDVMSMGYQLSMGVTALLVAISNEQNMATLNRDLSSIQIDRVPTKLGSCLRWGWAVMRVNIACWLVALPIVMFHAGVVGTLAPVVSVLMVPLIAVQMALGYAQIVLGIVWPIAAAGTVGLVELPGAWVLQVMDWTHGLGWSWFRVPRLSAPWAIITTMLLAFISVGRWRWYRPRVLACVGMVTLWALAHPMYMRPSSVVRTTMLDVGDGTCMIVQSGSRAIVWDCGSLNRLSVNLSHWRFVRWVLRDSMVS